MKRIVLDQPERISKWVADRMESGWHGARGSAIGLLENDEIIAGVLFDSWNGASICMHVAAVPGKRWMTREYLRVCFAYPFQQLRCNKILGLVGSKNTVAQRFDEHLGFVLEATLEAAHSDGALLIYSMSREQCRWISI